MFVFKDNSDNYFLSENATFPVIKLTGSMRSNSIIGNDHADSSTTSFSQKNHIEKCAIFCDLSEKVIDLRSKLGSHSLLFRHMYLGDTNA